MSTDAMLAAIAQNCGNRTETACGPAATAAADRNEGDTELARVLPVALGQGQVIQIGSQRAWRCPVRPTLTIGQGQSGHAVQRPSPYKGIEKIDDSAFAFVEDNAVHTVSAR